MKISIIDTGSANLNSVVQAFKRIGYEAIVSSEISELQNADRLVLPGVGTAAAVMDGINKYKLRDFILETKKPLLGICLGMQIQATDSEEVPLGQDSVIDCLDIVKSRVVKLKCDGLRLPHMGWNTVNHTAHPLFSDIKQDAYFYFDHSFAMQTGDYTIGKTTYGTEFSSAIAKDNFMGVQFHPEKSSAAGEQLLTNFIKNF
ncbi:glutamine amidotransferase [Succinivibrio dextrinosolvens]|uniref:imidazole glycerol phosphate synthase subunit HisH n=1 Tax=Succinivibrio dextrinosolvens TaxID=83771 RepID=UPI0008ED0BBE|nr:imidazole glycerol phosphate synthase subunit HisH [Succinivibrio dextrinosolvens]SFS33832.1 glutamine amidotransferase [Succinivibrio dextrinosolvens]